MRSKGHKRAAILEAALRLFGQYGYRRTSIDDIAREVEISLCQSLIERVESAVDRGRSIEGPFEERLLAVPEAKFGLHFETVHRSPHAAELIDSKNRLSADLFAEADRRYHRVARELIEDAVARCEIGPGRAGLKSAQAAELVIEASRGIELSARDPATYHRRLRELVHLMVTGLGRSANSMKRKENLGSCAGKAG